MSVPPYNFRVIENPISISSHIFSVFHLSSRLNFLDDTFKYGLGNSSSIYVKGSLVGFKILEIRTGKRDNRRKQVPQTTRS